MPCAFAVLLIVRDDADSRVIRKGSRPVGVAIKSEDMELIVIGSDNECGAA